MLTITTDDFLTFVDECLDGMVAVVEDLGDDLANAAPDLRGANTPYAVLTHCLGVMAFWGGHVIAGREVARDRDAEFTASGSVAELVRRVEDARRQLAADLAGLDPTAAPRGAPRPEDVALPFGRTQAGAAVHVLHELAQHLGQMELTRDVLVAGRERARP